MHSVGELPNAQVLLRAIFFQGALESFSHELDTRSAQRLARARPQQLPLGSSRNDSIHHFVPRAVARSDCSR